MKIRRKNWRGEIVTESIGSAVSSEINRAGGHGYGQIEQLEAELGITQEFLVRLCDVVADAMDPEDVYTLFGRFKSEEAQWDGFEVVEGDDEDPQGT
jgi:hypothetical protein